MNYPYLGLLWVLYDIYTGTRTFFPVLSVGYTANDTLQRTGVSSIEHSHPYQKILDVLYPGAAKTRGTRTECFVHARNLCEFCMPFPQYPDLPEVL